MDSNLLKNPYHSFILNYRIYSKEHFLFGIFMYIAVQLALLMQKKIVIVNIHKPF